MIKSNRIIQSIDTAIVFLEHLIYPDNLVFHIKETVGLLGRNVFKNSIYFVRPVISKKY